MVLPQQFPTLGFTKDLLGKIGQCGNGKRNACRNLHRLINRTKGVTVHLDLDVCPISIRTKRPVGVKDVWWPLLRMDSWLKYFFTELPHMILGGCAVDDDASWRRMFSDFWDTYKQVDGGHQIFKTGYDLGSCIPYMLHGDEGRGQSFVPFLVISWQPVISFRGPTTYSDSSYLPSYNNVYVLLFTGMLLKQEIIFLDPENTTCLGTHLHHGLCLRVSAPAFTMVMLQWMPFYKSSASRPYTCSTMDSL